MPIPHGASLSLPLTVVWPNHRPPAARTGTLVGFDGKLYRVRLDHAAPQTAAGERVILGFEAGDLPLVQGRVVSAAGTTLVVRHEADHKRDQREFVRVAGGLDVRYALLPEDTPEQALEAWVERGEPPGPHGAWRRPDPFMDLSGAGLAFDDEETCAPGDRLLLTLDIPGGKGPVRGVARVVRLHPLLDAAGERNATGALVTHRIAVDVERMRPADREALLAYTLDLQRLPRESPEGD
jgi:hypothetical protein